VPATVYPPGKFLLLISDRGCVNFRAIVQLGGLGKLKKIPVTSSGIKPMTFLLVV
jgi:hypothetical protein